MAEVSTTVLSANRCSASTSPTSSGATCSEAGRALSAQSSGRSSQTTSSRSAIGWSKAVIIRSATTASSSRLTSAVCAAVTSAGSASSSFATAIFRTWAAQAVAASRSAARVAPRPWSRWSIRPPGRVASSGVSALPGLGQPGDLRLVGEPPGPPHREVDRVGGQLAGGHGGDPVDELVRLVDDHDPVLGQDAALAERVDGEQRVVGHHDVGLGGQPPGPLGEALDAERAAAAARGTPAPSPPPAATPGRARRGRSRPCPRWWSTRPTGAAA